MSQPKDGSGRRIIVDLSFGDDSVNNITLRGVYYSSGFELTLPSLANLILDIINCKAEPKVFKIDIQCAFCNVRVDPRDALALGMKHHGDNYIDKSLAFSTVHSTVIFQRISDVIRKILQNDGIVAWNYIDDIFACTTSERADTVFNRIIELIRELGLPINEDKLVAPADEMTCMGIVINARDKTVKLPKEKLGDILAECKLNKRQDGDE